METDEFEEIDPEVLQEISRSVRQLKRPQNLRDTLVAAASNLMYRAEDLAKSFIDPGPRLQQETMRLMGQSREGSSSALVEFSMNLFWMSYRRFPQPLPCTNPGDPSPCYQDTNWGCTIRCAQMQFAYIYKDMNSKFNYSRVVKLFLDDEQARYSIHKICERASLLFQAKVKTYWSPLTAQQALASLYRENFNNEQEERSVRFLTFHNNNFSLTQNLLDGKETDPSYHIKKKLEGPEKPFLGEFDFYLINFVGMVGSENIDKINFGFIKKCMKIPSFCGIIGGIGNRALYIIGYCGDYLLYLDPHLTQQSIVQVEEEAQVDTYRVSQDKASPSRIKGSKYSNFKSSISLTFKVKSKDAVYRLIKKFSDYVTLYTDCSFNVESYTKSLRKPQDLHSPDQNLDSDQNSDHDSSDEFILFD